MQRSSQPNVDFNTLKENIETLIANVNSNMSDFNNRLNLSPNDANLRVVENFSGEMKQQLPLYKTEEKTQIIQLMQNLITGLHDVTSLRGKDSYEIIKQIFQKILPKECRADIINILQAEKYVPINNDEKEQEESKEEIKLQVKANGMQVQGLVMDSDWSGYFSGEESINIQQLSSHSQDDDKSAPTEDYFAEFIKQQDPIQNLIMLKMGLEQHEQQSQGVNQEKNIYDEQLQKAIEESKIRPVVLPCFIGNHYFAIVLYNDTYTIIDRSPHIKTDNLQIIKSKMEHKKLKFQYINPSTLLEQRQNIFMNVEAGGSASTSSNACLFFRALNSVLWKNEVEAEDRAFILDSFPDLLDLLQRNGLGDNNKQIFQEIQKLSEDLSKNKDGANKDKAKTTFRNGVIDIQLEAVNKFIEARSNFVTNEPVNTQSTTPDKHNIETNELLKKNIEAADKMKTKLLELQQQQSPVNPKERSLGNQTVNDINSAFDLNQDDEYPDDFEAKSAEEVKQNEIIDSFKELPEYIDPEQNNLDIFLKNLKIRNLEQELKSQYTYENILNESKNLINESVNQGQNDQEQNHDQASVSRLDVSKALPFCELSQLLTKQKILQGQYKKLFPDVKNDIEDYGVVIECRSRKDKSPDYIALTDDNKYQLVKSGLIFNNLNELNSHLTNNSLNPKELSLSSTSEDYELLSTFMGKVEEVNKQFDDTLSSNLITKFLNGLEQEHDESRISQPNNTSSQRDENQARLQKNKSLLQSGSSIC